MKKIVLGVLIMGLCIGCQNKVEEKTKSPKVEVRSLLDLDEYKNIKSDNIESINYIRFTEGGRDDTTITDKTEISRIYNNLKNTKIGEETAQACEDNTKVYEIKLQDGTTSKIEIECDWVIINKKRYLIIK